ncbi:uroporphyrinogen-III C-methyltransferase [Cryptosporangium aurantiacum]|uniref:Uroporphyrin-III C-methyltransferase / precorrin-2 dehydrogenase / sirohydrochlorin ferrochelatase n=1 Tax=Cryptosporangium aurantiacum TaxID=134849 RepID=A0A1M7Q943_9ACTN|nr:uroporphyrinogen-III C-methyltransferase [Cryptosporangium aurantiacum]SHN27064.1 uroporphyrin-III C-methyltransferase / precorrin-2 dehydrogenase / sirohydrochlorin ferrochelatase [Cryptosporangium aurantiacum]
MTYPVGLRLTGRRVLVVGGGTVAQRRVSGLLDAGAQIVLVAPEATPALDALAAAGRLRWERRPYTEGDVEGAWYVVAATDVPEVNAAVAEAAERAHTFCARADDGSDASAWTPAVGRHGQLTVAVHADRDPRRAALLRDAVVDRLSDGSLDAAPQRGRGPVPGVALVGAGPGDPELITVRGRRLLSHADVVVADRLAPQLLLDELPSHVEVVDASKVPYGRAMAQEAINETLVSRAKAGQFVVRLKGGDSFVFGRGSEELEACLAAGVPVEVVPGVTSAVSVPSAAWIPVTHRGIAHEFVVVSGHVAPDDPRSLVDWSALARLRGTLVILMGVERLPAITAALIAHGRPADTPAAVIQEGTTGAQRQVIATLGTVAANALAAGLSHPAICVVGEVVTIAERLTALASTLPTGTRV